MEIGYKEKFLNKQLTKLTQLDNALKIKLSFLDIIYIKSRVAQYIKTYADKISSTHHRKLLAFGISQPDFKFVDQAIFNYSSYELSKKEKFLLSLGLDFCLPCSKPSFVKYFSSFEKLARTILPLSNNESFSSFRRETSHLAYKTFTG